MNNSLASSCRIKLLSLSLADPSIAAKGSEGELWDCLFEPAAYLFAFVSRALAGRQPRHFSKGHNTDSMWRGRRGRYNVSPQLATSRVAGKLKTFLSFSLSSLGLAPVSFLFYPWRLIPNFLPRSRVWPSCSLRPSLLFFSFIKATVDCQQLTKREETCCLRHSDLFTPATLVTITPVKTRMEILR